MEKLTLDPLTSYVGGVQPQPLELSGGRTNDGHGIYLISHDYPMPSREVQTAGSSSTEGDPLTSNRYQNREITATVRVLEPKDAADTNRAVDPLLVGLASGSVVGVANNSNTTLPTHEPESGADVGFKFVGDLGGDRKYTSYLAGSPFPQVYSAYVWIDVGSTANVRLSVYTGGGVFVNSSTTITDKGKWVRASVTTPFSSAYQYGIEQAGAGNVTAYLTGQMLSTTAPAPAYFDGNTPGCVWSGTPHNSTSLRLATGGVRYDQMLSDIQNKIDTINRGGGVLRRITPTGKIINFNILDAEVAFTTDRRVARGCCEANFKFVCEPYGYGVEVDAGDNVETTLPALIFTEADVDGDVPALGRLVVDNDIAQPQFSTIWGLRNKNYSAVSNQQLFYQAESLTLLNGSILSTKAGASGAGNNIVFSPLLPPSYLPILSTGPLRHVGSYRVLLRLSPRPYFYTERSLTVALEWWLGTGGATTVNPPVLVSCEGNPGWMMVDLGVINLQKLPKNTGSGSYLPAWEGRILAKSSPSSTLNTAVDLDCLFFVPIDEGSGQVTAGLPTVALSNLSVQDTFDLQTAGNLAGKTALFGGVWGGAGDADDFTVDAALKKIKRVAVSDTSRRINYVTKTMTDMQVSVGFDVTAASTTTIGVCARYINNSNCLIFTTTQGGTQYVLKFVAGVLTNLGTLDYSTGGGTTLLTGTMTIYVDRYGRWMVWRTPTNGVLGWPAMAGQDTDLATGGPLASGYPGIVDEQLSATAATRIYDNFTAYTPNIDASIQASQSVEIRDDRVLQEDLAGTSLLPVTKYEGSYLKIPPAGKEKRISEIIVKSSRGVPNYLNDSAIDDLSARLYYTPRYLNIPT